MWPPPADPATLDRMRAAHATARNQMNLTSPRHAREAWGWHGRTLGRPVITSTGPAWLRLAAAPAGQASAMFWNGSAEAETAMPASLPKPRLRRWHDWHDHPWHYRAELYDHATSPPVSASPVLTSQPSLTGHWWSAARTALNTIAAVPTSRYTITPGYLRHAMPRHLGTPIDTHPPVPWTTAHGDFHFANITAPTFQILDFEGWGLAPAGYDAATLHTYSLLNPATTARIRHELSSHLTTPAGRHAELAAITELLDAATRGDHTALTEPLRHRAAILLNRPIPHHPQANPANVPGIAWQAPPDERSAAAW